MKKLPSFIFMLLVNCSLMFSQVGINTDGSTPDNSAILDVKSTSKGILIPRLTFEQRKALINPADGLMVFCLDCGVEGSLSMYSNGTWKSFSLCTSSAPAAGNNVYTSGQIVWNWTAVEGATGYRWNTTNYYSTAIDMDTGCSKTETGITCNTDYTRYVWSYNSCSNSEATTLTETTYAAAPAEPTAGINIPSMNQIVWNWNTAIDATGYKWGTINDYASALDMGSSTSKTEISLTCGTSYTRYVWAYNGFGHSTPVLSLTQTTLSCSSCGSSITINHLAGNVAPVNKTVTYGTVTNIPGETTKCWITSNLGADHQAIAKDDASEAPAGWYWQFNRMQGYKHDGTTLTPAWTITGINEPDNWTTANDPCSIELGTGWRVPTYTEWENVDAASIWFSLQNTWDSALKLHAAGKLSTGSGTLTFRGLYGYYWANTASSYTNGWHLLIQTSSCGTTATSKANGYTVRCIK
jgi:hypothetical protein